MIDREYYPTPIVTARIPGTENYYQFTPVRQQYIDTIVSQHNMLESSMFLLQSSLLQLVKEVGALKEHINKLSTGIAITSEPMTSIENRNLTTV